MFNHDTSRLNNFKPRGGRGEGAGKEALTLWRLSSYFFFFFTFFFLTDHGKISNRSDKSGEFSLLNEGEDPEVG